MVTFDWTSALVGVRDPRFLHVAHIFVLNDISPLFFPIAVQTPDYFVYVAHHHLFGMGGVTNRTLTSDGHLSEQNTAVAVTRCIYPADRFRRDASVLYLFTVAVLASTFRGVDLRLRGLNVK